MGAALPQIRPVYTSPSSIQQIPCGLELVVDSRWVLTTFVVLSAPLFQFAIAKQASCDVRRLQTGTLGRRVSCEVACYSHKIVPALRRAPPFPEPTDPRLQHLAGVEACIFPEKRPGGASSPSGHLNRSHGQDGSLCQSGPCTRR